MYWIQEAEQNDLIELPLEYLHSRGCTNLPGKDVISILLDPPENTTGLSLGDGGFLQFLHNLCRNSKNQENSRHSLEKSEIDIL